MKKSARTKKPELVKVVLRSRPLSEKEMKEGRKEIVKIDTDGRPTVGVLAGKRIMEYGFDAVLGPSCTQADVFEATASPIVDNILEGYNGTILCYGQTGSGKTYTMMGGVGSTKVDSPTSTSGLGLRVLDKIFSKIEHASNETQFLVTLSFMELYKENLIDLLDMKKYTRVYGDPSTFRPHLNVCDNPGSESGVFVPKLIKRPVTSLAEAVALLSHGQSVRKTASTNMNATSSRSHAIITITVESSEPSGLVKVGKLNLVDLAGSERQSKSHASKLSIEESNTINLSLTNLGSCIDALIELQRGKREAFVPYRDSHLTRLLQDSLGGNTKTVMIATVGPADYNREETMSTLRYASRTNLIKNNPHVNEDPKDAVIREFQNEIKLLKSQLAGTADAPVDPETKHRLHELEHQLMQGHEFLEKAKLQESELIDTRFRLEETETAYRSRVTEHHALEHHCDAQTGLVVGLQAELAAATARCNQFMEALHSMEKLSSLQDAVLKHILTPETRFQLEQLAIWNPTARTWSFPESVPKMIVSESGTTSNEDLMFEILENSTPPSRSSLSRSSSGGKLQPSPPVSRPITPQGRPKLTEGTKMRKEYLPVRSESSPATPSPDKQKPVIIRSESSPATPSPEKRRPIIMQRKRYDCNPIE
jgi:hypothetical protein